MTTVSLVILAIYIVLQLLAIALSWRALGSRFGSLSLLFVIPYMILAAFPVAALLLPDGEVRFLLERIGNIYLAFAAHFGVTLIVGSLIAGLIPKREKKRRPVFLPFLLAVLVGVTGTAFGMIHAQQTRVTHIEAKIQRGLPWGKTIRIALIADLHLDANSSIRMTERTMDLVNEQKPDLVLVAGDVFTSSYHAVRDADRHAKLLSGIGAPLGVYAIYGNHDVEERLFAGFPVHAVEDAFRTKEIEKFFEDCGFKVLEDEVVPLLDGGLYLAGRLDASRAGDGTANRKSAEELLSGIDSAVPLLVVDHEPSDFAALSAAGADVVFSGHTHAGQAFPGTIYVRIANENAYGYKTLFGMETFVTSGVGTFGPPVRTGTNSEVMIIDLSY